MKVYAHEIEEMVGPSLQKVDEVFRAARSAGAVHPPLKLVLKAI
jgi:hypothetical protein